MTDVASGVAPDLFPTLPEPPTDLGEFLTWFTADMPVAAFDANGNLVIKLLVHPEFKYNAMPLTDIRGRRFTVTIHTPRGRSALVAQDRKLAVYAAREKRRTRGADRAWGKARAAMFDGCDDDA